ncbi:MAG: hypothetical protein LBP67_02005 [Bacteroidales bacterium]|jgi:hypothetical protein|nr:hypothetical protein [Bacteroidales bacterium]
MSNLEPVHGYEDFVLKKFKEDPELGIEMLTEAVIEYKTTNDIIYVLLNLSRLISIRGYDEFEIAGLKRESISNVLQNKTPIDITLINNMLEILNIEERI